jgi:uncharacterized glyoxalase superfamily protein PhnB
LIGKITMRELKESPMSELAMDTRATLIPCLRYRDAPAAIDWLCRVFGFDKHAVYEGPGNTIAHAQLSFGNGMVMLGSAGKESAYDRLVTQPDAIGGKETQTVCVVTSDPDEIYRRATAAGAKILIDIQDEDYGGRGFTCSDLEGHVWNFGSYDPWK